jgi:hypothetical protein
MNLTAPRSVWSRPDRRRAPGYGSGGFDRLHQFGGRRHVPALGHGPDHDQDPVGGGGGRVALRYLPIPTGGKQQVLAALPLVGPGQAQVQHPPLVQVIGRAHQQPRRQLHHHRPGRQVHQQPAVGSVGVGREHQLPGSTLQHREHLVGRHPAGQVALPDGHHRHRGVEEPKGLHRPVQIRLVIGPLDGLGRREPTLEHIRVGRLGGCRHAASTGSLRCRPHPSEVNQGPEAWCRSSCRSFHQAPLGPTGAHSLDDPSDLSSKDGTRQYPTDGPLLSCKQQVGGSSPPANSQNSRSQACRTCLACRMSFRRARYSADGARGVLVEAPAGCTPARGRPRQATSATRRGSSRGHP